MNATAKFRWLRINMGQMKGEHPSAIHPEGSQYAMVLQQWHEGTEVWPDGGLEFGQWRDIPIEDAAPSMMRSPKGRMRNDTR